jgi:uncharacterized protein YukE
MATQSMNFDSISGSCKNLTSLATTFNGTIDNISSSIGKIQSPAWGGKASDNYRSQITKLIDNLPVAERQLALSVIFLANCAGGYQNLGDDAVNKLKELIGGQEYIDNFDVSGLPDTLSTYANLIDPTTDTTTTNPDQTTTTTPITTTGTPTGPSYYSGPSYSSTPISQTPAATPTPTPTATEEPTTVDILSGLVSTPYAKKVYSIPSDVKQGGYLADGYDFKLNSEEEVKYAEGTPQYVVHEIWKKQGKKFKNGIAVVNVNGEERYVVAVSSKYGTPGDCIDVTLENGKVIKCIIGDYQGGGAWGTDIGSGKTSILEFMVEKKTYAEKGAPGSNWNLDWDPSSPVKSIANRGSVIGSEFAKNELAKPDPQPETAPAPSEAPSTTDTPSTETPSTETPSTETPSTTETLPGETVLTPEDLPREDFALAFAEEVNNMSDAKLAEAFGGTSAGYTNFLSKVAEKAGLSSEKVIPSFTDASTGASWFKNNDLFKDNNYTPQSGDLLFVGSESPSDTAIVIGVKDGVIETIENSAGSVQRKTYNVGDANIYGYGTPDYSKLNRA